VAFNVLGHVLEKRVGAEIAIFDEDAFRDFA